MTTVYLGLGSNVGNPRQHIEKAISLLSPVLSDIKQAPFYLSKAVGYTDQPDFLNTAISGQTELAPEELLAFIKKTEQEIGRVERFHQGPREIDIDIIFYGDLVLKSPELTIPHPAFRDRDFVLQPLCGINPQMTDPVTSQTIAQLLDAVKPGDRSIINTPR
jgi:2-amino-4-hydroxy-6-hydroxymethyldihydropteridine diphosphokinase